MKFYSLNTIPMFLHVIVLSWFPLRYNSSSISPPLKISYDVNEKSLLITLRIFLRIAPSESISSHAIYI